VDQPPFSEDLVQFSTILLAWQPLPQTVQFYPRAPIVVVVTGDNPPFGIPRPDLWNILASWLPAAPPAPRMAPSFLVSISNLVPPFGLPGPNFTTILSAWRSPDPQPPRSQPLASIPGWSVDGPPRWTDLPQLQTILRAWQPPDPLPQRPLFSASEPGWSVDKPPFSEELAQFSTIIQAWQPSILPVQIYPHAPIVVVVSADNPPFGLPRPDLWNILSAWLPTPPPQRLCASRIISVDNPPFGIPNPDLGTILAAWRPPDPPPQRLRPSAASPGWSVDRPPQESLAALFEILLAWQPTPSQMQQLRKLIQPAALVPGDAPPYGGSNRNLWTILASWRPSPELPHITIFTPSGAPGPALIVLMDVWGRMSFIELPEGDGPDLTIEGSDPDVGGPVGHA
jgi:hypothetical protein